MVEGLINHFTEVARLIAKFQVIEVGLKVTIVRFELQTDRKNNTLKEGYSLQDVDELPYGVLLKRYAKIKGASEELHHRLLLLKGYRNFLAHKSLLAVSGMSEEMKRFIGVHSEPLDYVSLNQELDECTVLFSKQHVRSQHI